MRIFFIIILLFLSSICTILKSENDIEKDKIFIQSSANKLAHQKYITPAREKIKKESNLFFPFLISKLNSREPREVDALKRIFKDFQINRNINLLEEEISKKDKKTFSLACELYGLLGENVSGDFLRKFYDSKKSYVLKGILKAQGLSQNQENFPELSNLKNHQDYQVRWYLAGCLGKVNNEKANNLLKELLKDSLQIVHKTAYKYLLNNYQDNHKKLEEIKNDYEKIRNSNSKHSLNISPKALSTLQMTEKDFFLPFDPDSLNCFFINSKIKTLFKFPLQTQYYTDSLVASEMLINKYLQVNPLILQNISLKKRKDKNSNLEVLSRNFLENIIISEKEYQENIFKTKNLLQRDSLIAFINSIRKFEDIPLSEEIYKIRNDLLVAYSDPDKDLEQLYYERLSERNQKHVKKYFYQKLEDNLNLNIQQDYISHSLQLTSDFLNELKNIAIASSKQQLIDVWYKNIKYSIILGTTGEDNYQINQHVKMIVDPGGNDNYFFSDDLRRNILIFDFGGNDLYKGNANCLASSCFGFSLNLDFQGDDIYIAKNNSLSASIVGFSFFADFDGNDSYTSKSFSQSASLFGKSLFFELIGNDFYLAEKESQAFAQIAGYSVLNDHKGNDKYFLESREKDVLRYDDHYITLGQGYSFGDRPYAAGGIALLLDQNGNDNYKSDIFGGGGAYWLGLGALYDFTGNDHYESYQYSLGSGVHLAFGLLKDLQGNDFYQSKGVSLGCGHDYAGGFFYDHQGNDYYFAQSLSIGASNANSISIFNDKKGDDVYKTTETSTLGYSDWRRDAGLIGIFEDLEGNDIYLTPQGSNNKSWKNGTWGVGIDY